MEKVVISPREIADANTPVDESSRPKAELPAPVPLWARCAISPLVLVLPILCLVVIVLRVATRGLPPRNRYAWLGFLSSLLIASGLLTSVASVLAVSLAPLPSIVSEGQSDLDAWEDFPALPAKAPMSARNVSDDLKPLVAVITPAKRSWFSRGEFPASSIGAGILLQAGPDGYLIATARHVVQPQHGDNGRAGDSVAGESKPSQSDRALVAMTSGVWSGADVVGWHNKLDLSLLWVPRRSGTGNFIAPIAAASSIGDGDPIFVIGHPQGLRFTLSTGIVSRAGSDVFQISAPISPGNSGGPVFDDRGELAGIVTSTVDKNINPNAENLNFAVRADALLQPAGWTFIGNGRQRLEAFLNAQPRRK